MNPTLKEFPFWNDLTPDEQQKVTAGSTERSYEKGADIHGFSDACLGIVYIQKGSIRVYMTSEEGREITLFHLGKGECCVFSSACVIGDLSLDVQLRAEEPVTLAAIHAGTVQQLMQGNLSVRCFVYELATKRYASVVWVLQQILFDHFDQRLARLLLSVCQKTGSRTIRMTQEAMAQEVNSAREVVARMLRQFASEGWITMDRGNVTLEDIDALRKIAG